jgi:putative YpdA family bacillithiol system oxidoreductase
MGFGQPREGMEIPYTDEHHQTNIPGIYITGELGGMGLIRNAFQQGIRAVHRIADLKKVNQGRVYDVVIVGGGPSGIGAALAAHERGLNYVVLEQGGPGGTVLHYPKHKVVLTQPVELPLYGKLKVSEISKEELLALFATLMNEYRLNVRTNQKVEAVQERGGFFHVSTGTDTFMTSAVILALGRRGSPRKLGVPGEEMSKVLYRLEDAEHYTNWNLLVVGGGDSAVEAAVGLARQKGNTVTISYRRDGFIRLKEKNDTRVTSMIRSGEIQAIFQSEVVQIQKEAVVLRESEKVLRTVPNDYVFIFAGGELPGEFLKKTGIQLRTSEHVARPAIAV